MNKYIPKFFFVIKYNIFTKIKLSKSLKFLNIKNKILNHKKGNVEIKKVKILLMTLLDKIINLDQILKNPLFFNLNKGFF
jgi:hypothetical protein